MGGVLEKDMLIVVRKAMAELDLEELRTLLERMEMYVEEEGGFSRGQRDSVVASAAALRTALAVPRGHMLMGCLCLFRGILPCGLQWLIWTVEVRIWRRRWLG